MILDYDKDGNIVGLEILDASKRMENPRSVEYAVTAGRVSSSPRRTVMMRRVPDSHLTLEIGAPPVSRNDSDPSPRQDTTTQDPGPFA